MKVYLRTYGCRANHYDTEAVRAILAQSGVIETADIADADAAIFNSCTVTAAAEADLRADVRAASRVNPSLRTVVMGCAAGLPTRDETVAPLRSLPTVHAVVPGADLSGIGEALGIDFSFAGLSRTEIQTGARALLRIQDGCDEHCTFCATTLSRGSSRSRSVDEIVGEARILAASHPEIVLTGIHIGSYGADIGSSLGRLVETLVSRVDNVRFRLTSVEATEVDERLAELLVADSRRVAPHLHAPLQSGSNTILKRMGRNWYVAESYRAATSRIFEKTETFALAADVIAGFPGETEEDHRATVHLIQDLPFNSLHVFPYSARPGTSAVRLRNRVPAKVARERSAELRTIAEEKKRCYEMSRLGGKCDVVVIERGKGLTEDYLSVAVSDPSIPRRGRFHGTLRLEAGILTAVPLAPQS